MVVCVCVQKGGCGRGSLPSAAAAAAAAPPPPQTESCLQTPPPRGMCVYSHAALGEGEEGREGHAPCRRLSGGFPCAVFSKRVLGAGEETLLLLLRCLRAAAACCRAAF